MRKRHIVLPIALFLLLSGQLADAKQRQFTAKQRDNICEVVFRFLLPDTQARYGAKVYFLSVNGKDPSKSLLRRFRDWRPPVKPVSESKILKSRNQVVDRKTNEPAAIVAVGRVKRVSGTKAEVEGGYFANGLAAAEHRFTVELKKGKWAVTKHKLILIS